MIKIFFSFFCIVSFLIGSEYESWLKSQNEQYLTYKKTLDDEFSDMLKKEWEEFNSSINKKTYLEPKPEKIPEVLKPIAIPKEDLENSKKVFIPVKKETIKELPKQIVLPIVEKKKYDKNFQPLQFDFYGQKIAIEYDKKFHFNLDSINKTVLGNLWKDLSQTEYKKLIEQVERYSKAYSFNDWAKYLLVYNIGLEIYNHDKNKSNLFTWYILIKMGYDTKVGYSKSDIFLLASVKQDLFQVAFFNLAEKKYFVLTPYGRINSIGAIYTYVSDYPEKLTMMSFDMAESAININTNIVSKKLLFTEKNNNITIDTHYSKDLISFYKNFPQSEYPLYFKSKVSYSLTNTLLLSMKPLVEGKTEIEAVNLLLYFVQNGFAYKTDEQQFGYEKVLFPEETIHYSFSDCEDRAILFSHLVKNLLGLDVVAVKYSDHLATAVAFSTPISGDSFKYNDKKYIITDPTYINAKAGMTMPKYKNQKFEVIKFN